MKQLLPVLVALFGLWVCPFSAHAASAAITEIMYDLPGNDTEREWIEVQNTGSEAATFAEWKFVEGNTNHRLTLHRGDAGTPPGGFAVIADDPATFLIDWPSFSGTLFDSSFSLGNSGETLSFKLGEEIVDTISYASTTGAAGDGNSLQKVGGSWQALSPTPAAAGADASAPPAATSSSSSPSAAPEGNAASAPSGGGGGSAPLVPHITVKAIIPRTTVAGGSVFFKGSAFGLKGDPLPNARFLWSFGDGGVSEGKNVSHVYHYPAAYVVLLTVSSGELSATDRGEVIVAEPAFSIPRIKEGADGFIEIKNSGAIAVDLSAFILKSGALQFVIPQGTVLSAGNAIPYPGAVTRLSADPKDTALLYPNGAEAARYIPVAAVPVPVVIEAPTPPKAVTPKKAPVIAGEKEAKEAVAPGAVSVSVPVVPRTSAANGTGETTATSSFLIASVGESGAPSSFLLPLLSLAALLGVSVAGYVFLIRTPTPPATPADKLRQEAEEYDLVE